MTKTYHDQFFSIFLAETYRNCQVVEEAANALPNDHTALLSCLKPWRQPPLTQQHPSACCEIFLFVYAILQPSSFSDLADTTLETKKVKKICRRQYWPFSTFLCKNPKQQAGSNFYLSPINIMFTLITDLWHYSTLHSCNTCPAKIKS